MLTDELMTAKLKKKAQLQQVLNTLYCREEIEDVSDEDFKENITSGRSMPYELAALAVKLRLRES
ncbi:hypothetical protein SETIT_9G136700v2 [Setaria italica]|uniref:Uncharacterized protein n=2 Tax=Setaria TaxID=4554 RepID=A0A368SGF1_SETIT|nr:hypothetical protein SETIT_9G136700v2 [Setaria italica]TKV91994.1 hypothetical protein SEVIR_9G135200v2 [Setaria viridis]